MKNLSYTVILVVIMVMSACQKNSVVISSSLLGNWKLRASYISIGGPLIKKTGIDTSLNVEFNADGTLQGTAYPGIPGYHIIDSVSVSLIRSDHNATVYYYNVKQDTLTLANAGCVEGCPMKFVKRQ